MSKAWMMMLCLLCLGMGGCMKKENPSTLTTRGPALNNTPIMINAQAKTGVLRMTQLRLNQLGNRLPAATAAR